MFCESNSKAKKSLRWRVGISMCAYVPLLLCAGEWVKHHPPTGLALFLLAALPALPVIAMFAAVGVYFKEEQDEYERNVLIGCMLWGTGALLTVLIFSSFLKIFGWKGEMDSFVEMGVFWAFMVIARITYRVRNRVTGDE
jgi:hypothetical protein